MWLSAKFGFVGMMEFKILGDICNIVSGGTPPRSKSQYWDNGNIPWIKIRDIKSKYIEDSEESITIEGLNNSSTKLLTKGTVLYTIFATLGEVGILKIDACTNQAIAGLTVKDETKILPEYLYYYLKSKKNIVNKLGRGAAQNNINLSMLKSFEIEIIDIIKQNNIIRTLNYVDNLIKLKSRELELLDELVKARFVELFGDPIINDKGLITELLANISNLKAGKAIKIGELSENNDINSLFPCFGGNGIRGYINRYTHDGTFPIIGRQGALSGNVNFASGKFYATEHAIVVTPKVELDNTWFFYCLKYLDLKRFQTGAAQPGVSVEKLNNISIPLPNYKSQLYFSNFVKEVDKSRFIIKSMIKEGLL